MPPTVCDFLAELLALDLIQFGNLLEEVGTLCDERTLAQQREDVLETAISTKGVDVLEELFTRNPDLCSLEGMRGE